MIHRGGRLSVLTLSALFSIQPSGSPAAGSSVIALDSPSPLVQLRIMVGAGSAQDPSGLEGLAYLSARLLVDGGFGDASRPTTKDALAAITRPWGEAAFPSVIVGKETTVLAMTVPREHWTNYLDQVLRPLLTRPVFAPSELDRLRAEALQQLRSDLRLEQIELLGLTALDNLLYEGTGYAHPSTGTDQGLQAVTADEVRRFYATYYRPDRMVVGVSSADPSIGGDIEGVVSELSRHRDQAYPVRSPEPPRAPRGRDLLIVTMPNAISTGLHAGFPLPLLRSDPDYWPLYVANLWFGTHRDSFSHLYEVIRNQRGYNYGDYSYIEHFEGRPFYQFPPPHHPRRQQCFSIWIRPVQHDYAHHILKAFTWELENFIRTGLSEEDFALARNKARVMYLNLAETTARLLGSRLDDAFYGMSQGYLDSYLTQIEAVSRERVNAAVRKYLDAAGLRFVIVTDDEHAPRLADEIASGGPAWGKSLGDYQVASRERDGRTVYELSEENLEMLRRDAAWAHYWLDIPRDRIRVVPSAKLFETAALPR